MKPIIEYEIISHGIEHPDYFQGCGTSFTGFDLCVTGIGDTEREALEDAIGQLAEMDFDTTCLDSKTDKYDAIIRASEENDTEDAPYWHVSVRVR